MPDFNNYDAADMLGLTPLSRTPLSDSFIWDHLLTPSVKAFLGPVRKAGKPIVFESTQGHFPGDNASNLNNHLINGQPGFVRYPYVSVMHRCAFGALVIKRDFRKIAVWAWIGDVEAGKAEPIYLLALRDRRYDGTKAANDCAMLTFRYEDSFNRPITADLNSLEISIYSFTPGSRIKDACGDLELDAFVEKPFTFLDRPQLFQQLFARAWESKRAPGQHAAPIKDVSQLLLPNLDKVAKRCGYDLLEAACSHYHVVKWLCSSGYAFSYRQHEEALTAIQNGLKRIRDKGRPLTRSQQSWVCVLQSLPSELIPEDLKLGVEWPQDNISPASLWVAKPISQRAEKLVLPVGFSPV